MGRGRESLSSNELDVIDNSITDIKDLASRKTFLRCDDHVRVSMLLTEGFVGSYILDRKGRRQLVAVHVPGDLFDLHGFMLGHIDHDVAAIGPAKVAVIHHQTLKSITEQLPDLTKILWFSTLLDGSIHREWIFRLGRLGAEGRVAHLLCELSTRLNMVGLVHNNVFALPLTQPDLAEATGLTAVHINRVLRGLRERGLATVEKRQARILDWHRLAELGEFVPDYLYGSKPIR